LILMYPIKSKKYF